MLAIGRGLVARPKILLLDEPSLGLAPILVQEIFHVIRQIHEEESVTILLVEQNARKALGIADYGYILEIGKIAIQDTAAALRNNEQVRAAYLGGGHVQAAVKPTLAGPAAIRVQMAFFHKMHRWVWGVLGQLPKFQPTAIMRCPTGL